MQKCPKQHRKEKKIVVCDWSGEKQRWVFEQEQRD